MATAAVETRTVSDELDELGVMGLLKAIAAGEAEGGRRILDWAGLTDNVRLADTLRFIVVRERSHSDVFARRVAELGDSVDVDVVPEQAAYLSMLADPAVPEADKAMCILGGGDFFCEIERRIEDGGYDPLTGKLLTWYLAEERDSQARLRQAMA